MHETVYAEISKFALMLRADAKLLIGDVGSYDVNGCLRPIFNRPPWIYRGIDVAAGPNVDIITSSEESWDNINDAYFDVIVSVSTLEHTRRPWKVVAEIARTLKPGGRGCLCVPYAWPLHNYPIDCWRILPDGLSTILEDAGLRVVEMHMTPFPVSPPERGDTCAVFTKP